MKIFTTSFKTVLILAAFSAAVFTSCKKSDDGTATPTTITPVVTNVQPKTPAVGDVVTITGTGFGTVTTDVKVTIGTQVITIQSVADTQIKFTLPTGITAGDIAVAIKNIIANNTDPQKATITPQAPTAATPTITAISPTTGKVGDVVTITGTNFTTTIADNVVKFNGVAATVTAATATTLTVTVPATATTGAVSLSVKSVAATTSPTFTVTATTTGTTGTPVSYFTVLSGTATFNKIATAPSEIGAMTLDKKNGIIYYADYAQVVANHPGNLYRVKLDGSAPEIVTTDARIVKIVSIATDPTGNIYVLASLDNLGGVQVNAYKIDFTTSAITTIGTNVNYGGSGTNITIDSQGGLWVGYGQKLNSTTNVFDRNSAFPYGTLSTAAYQGDDIYVDDVNHLANSNIGYYKYNLLTKVGVATDFTLQGLFKQDYPAIGSLSGTDSQQKFAVDNSENFYAILPINGDASTAYQDSYVIRKTKNGSGTSTLISKFYTKAYSVASPVFYITPRLNTGLLFKADATGNLYLKANATDIIKITY